MDSETITISILYFDVSFKCILQLAAGRVLQAARRAVRCGNGSAIGGVASTIVNNQL
jgi:hypothetical protein